MSTKKHFLNIGTLLLAVDQIMSIGLLDDLTSICVVFKNPSFDPVVIEFTSEVYAKDCFVSAVEAL